MVNLEERFTVGDTLTQDSTFLLIPGLPNVTFRVSSSALGAVEVYMQVALRKTGIGKATYGFTTLGPGVLVSSAAPLLFEVNLAAQAIRIRMTNNTGGGVTLQTYLMATA